MMQSIRVARSPRIGFVHVATGTRIRTLHSRASSAARRRIWGLPVSIIGATGLWWWFNTQDEVPSLDSRPTDRLIIDPGPSEFEVTRILTQGSFSFPVNGITGINRYDGVQLASNSPCEDRFTHGKFPSPFKDGGQCISWGVFDGHAGWQTADLLSRELVPFVRQSLSQVDTSLKGSSAAKQAVQDAIKRAFVSLDNAIIKPALDLPDSAEQLQDKLRKLAPAYAGSCALLSLYDPAAGCLHVACTGDSRAVLGQQRQDGTWEVIALSTDQTGSNEEEGARIKAEHPGEENIMKDGRVLGLMVSRAFGDGRWKWPLAFQQDIRRRFYGPSLLTPRYEVQTPPYLTAEPVVTTTKFDPAKPSFLILATDGLWDMLSNEQAVDLVGKWLDPAARDKERSVTKGPESTPSDFGNFWKGVKWRFDKERTTTQDDNVAVHLVRNALGGSHHELLAGRLALEAPFSRKLRDDVTAQVVFSTAPCK